MMKHYEKLLAKGSFSREQLIEIVGTATAANQVIYEYQKKGLIEKVKRDFYVVISMETKQPVLSRYQIGSNLFPDACFYLLLLIFTNQVVKTLIGEPEEFIHTLISGHRKKFMVCIKKFVIFLVCSVYDKCTRKVFGDISKCKAQLFANNELKFLIVRHTSIFPVKLYFIESCICTAHEL